MANPTHIVKLIARAGQKRSLRAGVGWMNSDGWIQIELDTGIVLNWKESKEDYYISIFPINEKEGD